MECKFRRNETHFKNIMSGGDDTSSYREIVSYFIRRSAHKIKPGHTTLLLWKDREHLREWQQLCVEQSEGVRIFTAPNATFAGLIEVKGNVEQSSIVGIAITKEQDLSDTVLLYYVEVEKKQ